MVTWFWDWPLAFRTESCAPIAGETIAIAQMRITRRVCMNSPVSCRSHISTNRSDGGFKNPCRAYPFPMRTRFEQATAVMKSTGVDALVLTPGADLFYLTGFEHGHAGERLLAL